MLSRLRIDKFTLALLGVIVLSFFVPARGQGATLLGYVTQVAVALVFFLHGARLQPAVVIAGLKHWRLYLAVLGSTYVLFPVLALATGFVVPSLLSPELYAGILFLSALPSTVQSAITFSSIGRGNVPAAICSASASNLLSVVLTPLLVTFLLSAEGAVSLRSVEAIVLQLLVPFMAGQVLQRWIGPTLRAHSRVTGLADRGSILLIVYAAFSQAVVARTWAEFEPREIITIAVLDAVLLLAMLLITTYGSRALGFKREDEITIVFGGSNKSLATGMPVANILFAGPKLGAIILPIMLFHQIQLIVCAWLARRYAERAEKVPLPVSAE
jgi:sodium/bile acid cotransporter 7